jgi:hypothetical protein
MQVNIGYPITWLHDALIAAHPNVQWSVQGIDGEWAEVCVDGEWPDGFDLEAFAATVQEPVIMTQPTVEERLAAVEEATLALMLGGF